MQYHTKSVGNSQVADMWAAMVRDAADVEWQFKTQETAHRFEILLRTKIEKQIRDSVASRHSVASKRVLYVASTRCGSSRANRSPNRSAAASSPGDDGDGGDPDQSELPRLRPTVRPPQYHSSFQKKLNRLYPLRPLPPRRWLVVRRWAA